jgi:cell division protein FtsI (penicillin-binding protein 3)
MFEPGSVFKIVTASAALEEKVSLSQERFFCENGSYRVVSHTLHDHRPHGWLAFREVFEQSSNIGTVKIAQDLGAQPLYRYMRLFGFGSKTGVDLPGEISGVAKEPRQWSKISIAAIPIGQEVGVTALQLANAISALANKGRRMRPYILQSVKDKFGQTIKEIYPLLVQEVVSAETAETLKDILRGVVENGTGKMARLKGFAAAGKTGTAQKVDPDGRYSHDKYIASFIGFAPLEDPRLAVGVMVDEPRPSYFGGVVAAPVFKKVVDDALRYLNVTVASEQFVAWHETKGNN